MSDGLIPPVLNPATLYKEEAKRDATRIRIYNMVLTQIYNKIKAIARIPGNERSLIYVVPEFIPGTPRFDIGDAILYIVWNLRNAGYVVSYTHPNLLYITWKPHDERYKNKESPWSVVLNTVRNSVLNNDVSQPPTYNLTPAIKKPIKSEMIEKRKTPLKKTVEFKPYVEVASDTLNRSNIQISERNISFV